MTSFRLYARAPGFLTFPSFDGRKADYFRFLFGSFGSSPIFGSGRMLLSDCNLPRQQIYASKVKAPQLKNVSWTCSTTFSQAIKTSSS
ncbi:hypothetical protein L596_000512 [Steinernema carpocapsae]|uniref:Uncharacterized protein n=1 Tax=Steinernema carpocapsae TaxID=34508 RepID=A0A4U8UKR4_STECR|nr:hypothetical protein L596_000512 [Steinernema carpocapsae]